MKGKFILLLSTLLLLSGSVPWLSLRAATYELQNILMKDQQVSYDQVKDGDIFAFNSGMYNYTKTNPQQDVPNLFLCGRTFRSTWSGMDALGVLTGLTSDNLFQLEAAPDQTFNGTTFPSFYLKHVNSGKYVTGTSSNRQAELTSDKTLALSFSFQSVSGYPSAGGANGESSDYMNDQTLCLVHYEGTAGCFLGPAWNYGFAQYSSTAPDCSPWNVFTTKESKSVYGNLQYFYSTIKNSSYSAGSEPGYYAEDKVNAFTQAEETAANALTENSNTDEELKTILDNLYTAYLDVEASKIPITDGYYNIINAYPQYETLQGVKKAMSTNTIHQLSWGTYDANDPFQLFKITAVSDTSYTIQNIATGEYLNTIDGTSSIIPTTPTPVTNQTIKIESGTAQFHIANLANTISYHTAGHLNGNGISGLVVTWESAANSASVWYLHKVTDQAAIDKMTAEGPQALVSAKLKVALDTAEIVRNSANDFTELITKGTQITTNSIDAGSSSPDPFTALIDGNTSTIFHSAWDTSFKAMDLTEGTGWHNLQFNLPYAVTKFKFNFTGRESDTYADTPNDIVIFGTNDDNLGASTANADSTSWSRIIELNNGFPSNVSLAQYSSPTIDLGGAYKYLRFVVQHTTNENKTPERTFGTPEVSGVTFNLSELQLYDAAPSELSEYFTVAGMKEACDAIDQLITATKTKIANGTATEADVDALKSATAAVKALYVDRDVLDDQMAALLDSSNIAYEKVNPSKVSLITSGDQISSNSMSNDDGSAYANLIDGDLTTVFHSHWDGAMGDATTTADSWQTVQEAWVTANPLNVAVGVGYHNLQVKLNQPVSTFYLSLTGRGDTDYHDTPNDIAIYGTNDDALGASTDEADLPNWTSITELKDGFPGDVKFAQYTSPELNLGASYKYIRFVIKGTTHMNTVAARTFSVPDITGVTFNLMEFQLYTGADPQRVQYNYVTGMKDAADALKALINTDSQLKKHSMLTTEPINTLRAALNNVLSLYADTTDFAALYNRYKQNVDSSVVGTGIGFVDTQEAIDAFGNVVKEARTSVSLTQPTVQSISAATNSMNTAFKTFMTHVGKVATGQWYCFISGSNRAFTQNQPIFLGSTSVGGKLYIGGYPVDQIDPKGDPYAAWRFVPIEGQEEQFAIQNMGTGQYFGAYRGDGADNSPLLSHEKTPYKLLYAGNGKFKIIQANLTNMMDALKTDQTNSIVLNYPLNSDNQQAWKFEPTNSKEEGMTFNTMADNNICIMTLPFELKGSSSLMEINDMVKTYAVKSITTTATGTELGLKLKKDIEAGEPFIMTVNDYNLYDPSAPSQALSIAVPDDVVDTSMIVSNGLIGTLQGMSVKAPGMGIFSQAKLKATTGAVTIDGRSGYINPNRVVNEEGEADLIINTNDMITLVKPVIVAKSTENVNVYSIDGKLLKKGIKATEAQKNLNKGIYIIGKKKIAIK